VLFGDAPHFGLIVIRIAKLIYNSIQTIANGTYKYTIIHSKKKLNHSMSEWYASHEGSFGFDLHV